MLTQQPQFVHPQMNTNLSQIAPGTGPTTVNVPTDNVQTVVESVGKAAENAVAE